MVLAIGETSLCWLSGLGCLQQWMSSKLWILNMDIISVDTIISINIQRPHILCLMDWIERGWHIVSNVKNIGGFRIDCPTLGEVAEKAHQVIYWIRLNVTTVKIACTVQRWHCAKVSWLLEVFSQQQLNGGCCNSAAEINHILGLNFSCYVCTNFPYIRLQLNLNLEQTI